MMKTGRDWILVWVALLCFVLGMKALRILGIEPPTFLLFIGYIGVLVWQNRRGRICTATRSANVVPDSGIRKKPLATPLVLALAVGAMIIGVITAMHVMSMATVEERQIVNSLIVPGWTCLVAMKFYGAKLAGEEAQKRRGPLIHLWLAQGFVIFLVPGFVEYSSGVKQSAWFNHEPLAMFVWAGAGILYLVLSRDGV